jgi:hypothetical protein
MAGEEGQDEAALLLRMGVQTKTTLQVETSVMDTVGSSSCEGGSSPLAKVEEEPC